MFKTELRSIIRILGLSKRADKSRYYLMRFKNRKANHLFKQAHPGITLPLPYMVYESFQIDYKKYYFGGLEDAAWIVSLFKLHHQLEKIKILHNNSKKIGKKYLILKEENLYILSFLQFCIGYDFDRDILFHFMNKIFLSKMDEDSKCELLYNDSIVTLEKFLNR